MSKFEEMSDQYLRETYVPDVYQKTIFSIDYLRLKEAGIRILTFDMDDTIKALEGNDVDKATVTLFEKLKAMGFVIAVISNNTSEKRVARIAERLGVEGIHHAEKPSLDCFREIVANYNRKHIIQKITPKEMAHIGNSLLSDVASGNAFGTTTCLVRNIGALVRVIKLVRPDEKELQHELEKRGIWVKHHQQAHHDQYYQLGERPAYQI